MKRHYRLLNGVLSLFENLESDKGYCAESDRADGGGCSGDADLLDLLPRLFGGSFFGLFTGCFFLLCGGFFVLLYGSGAGQLLCGLFNPGFGLYLSGLFSDSFGRFFSGSLHDFFLDFHMITSFRFFGYYSITAYGKSSAVIDNVRLAGEYFFV